MMFSHLCALSVLLLASVAQAENDALDSCQAMTHNTFSKYHEKDKCNHAWQTSFQLYKERAQRHAYLGKSGLYPLIPSQKTVVCPLEPVDISPPTGVIGQDTRWIVENKSSGRVVVIFVDEHGVERSAMNNSITPPQADPHAIMTPGEHKVVNTFEGHVLYVRELLANGMTGDVLLQHRPGVMEFTNRYDQQLDCQRNAVIDENVQEDTIEKSAAPQEEHSQNEASPISKTTDNNIEDAPRTATNAVASGITRKQASVVAPDEPSSVQQMPASHLQHQCNMIYQGFRNTLPNCPLDVYFAGTGELATTNGPLQCNENLTFRLGNEDLDNAYEDEGRIKFEVTYMSHSFVARLQSNPDIVVDTFTMQPTEVHDCPRRTQGHVIMDQVLEFNGIQHGNANLQNSTNGITTVLPCESSFVLGSGGVSS
jgi:hypothetical protein